MGNESLNSSRRTRRIRRGETRSDGGRGWNEVGEGSWALL